MREAAARDGADHDVSPVSRSRADRFAAPSCCDGREFPLLRRYLARSGEGRGVAARCHADYVRGDHRVVDGTGVHRDRHRHRCPLRAHPEACRLADGAHWEPRPIGNTIAVAGLLPAGREWFERVQPANYASLLQRAKAAA